MLFARGEEVNWDQYFMSMAHAAAAKSKDPSTRVGAVIADAEQRIVSTGYNGPPRGTDDRAVTDREIKLLRTLHAEENAILFAGRRLHGCTLYATHPPCAHCAAVIIQAGIRTVFSTPPPSDFDGRWADSLQQAKLMFSEACVQYLEIGP